jgi:hypothetical protein
MVDTVKSRPSHYELLGLSPSATSEEIGRAFVREMSRPRAFGGITELSVAYETLRNPARRRTYDASIGVSAPRTEPPKPAVAWRAQAQFVAAPAATPRPAELQVRPEPAAKAEPVLPSFLANALRELAEPAPLDSQAREAPRAASGAGPRVAPPSAPPAALETPIDEVEDEQDGGAQWKRIAIPAAGLVAVVGLIGAWAGWQSQGAPAARTEQAALLAPPTTFAVGDPANAAAQGDAVLDKDEPLTVTQPKRTAHVASRRAKPRPVSHLAEIEQQLTPPTETAAAEPAPAEQVAAAEPAKAVAASMPLSNSVIARTIARIGYPCGSVASTSQILGKAFTVTCTSGHTYRAAPVRGRYHFRQVKGG